MPPRQSSRKTRMNETRPSASSNESDRSIGQFYDVESIGYEPGDWRELIRGEPDVRYARGDESLAVVAGRKARAEAAAQKAEAEVRSAMMTLFKLTVAGFGVVGEGSSLPKTHPTSPKSFAISKVSDVSCSNECGILI